MLSIFMLKVSILWRLGWADVAHRCYGNVHSDAFAVASLFSVAGFSWFKDVSPETTLRQLKSLRLVIPPVIPSLPPPPADSHNGQGERFSKKTALRRLACARTGAAVEVSVVQGEMLASPVAGPVAPSSQ
jgi:hypothetical protein